MAQSLDNAKASAKGLSATLRNVGAIIGTVFVTGKIAGFFKSAIGGSANLEQALARVKAVSGATNDEMAKIKAKAEELGASTRYTATQAAEGFEILARAGLDANQQIQVIPSVLALAQGQAISMGESAQFVGDAVTIMGGSFDEAGRYADVLAKGASASTTVPQLANAISYTGQYAKEAGFDIEGLVGILDVLAQSGLRGERAGTALKNIFAQLQDPTSKAARELEKLGIKTDSLSGVINGLKSAGDNGAVAINAFGTEAGPTLRALLTGGVAALNEYTDGVRNAGGAAQEAARVMDNTFVGSLEGLKSAWDSVKNKLGEPVLEPIRNQINRLSDLIRNWVSSGEIKKLGDYFAQVFGDMSKAVVDFVENFTLDDTKQKVADFANDITARLDKFGASVSFVYNTLATGGNVLLTGVYAIGNAFAQVFADITSYIPGMGDISQKLQDFATSTAEKVVESAEDMFDSANRTRESYKAMIAETGKNTEATKENTKATKDNAKVATDSAEAKKAALDKEIQLFNEKSQRLAELKELEAAYAMQTFKDADRESEIRAKVARLEGEIATAIMDKTLTEIEGSRKAVEAKQKTIKATKQEKSAVEAVGLSLDEMTTGITDSEQKVIGSFDTMVAYIDKTATSSRQAGEMMDRYLVAALDNISTPAGLKQYLSTLEAVKNKTPAMVSHIEVVKERIYSLNDSYKALLGNVVKATDPERLRQYAKEAKAAYDQGKLSADEYGKMLEKIKEKEDELKDAADESGAAIVKARGDGVKAAGDATKAIEKNTEATERNTKVTTESGGASEALLSIVDGVRSKYEESTGALEVFNRANESGWVIGNLKDYFDHLADAAAYADKFLAHYHETVDKVATTTEELSQKTADGTVTMRDLQLATDYTRTAMSYLNDESQLDGLNAAIDAARAKMKSLQEEAEETAKSIKDRLLDATQSDIERIERQYDEEIAEIREKRDEAQNAKIRSEYEKAIRDLQQLKKIALDEQRERAKSSGGSSSSSSSSNNTSRSSSGASGGAVLNLDTTPIADALANAPAQVVNVDTTPIVDALANLPTPTVNIDTTGLKKHLAERERELTKSITKAVEEKLTNDIRKAMKGRGAIVADNTLKRNDNNEEITLHQGTQWLATTGRRISRAIVIENRKR